MTLFAYSIIGSTPSILGCLLCLSQQLLCYSFWGKLSIILLRNAGPYIHVGQCDMTTYFLKHMVVT